MQGRRFSRRDLLGAQMLLDRDRIVGAAFDRGVVGDDHALTPGHATDAGDQAGGGHRVLVHAEGRELRQLEERRADVEQRAHPLARQQLAAAEVALARGLAAALLDHGDFGAQIRDQSIHRLGVGAKRRPARIDLAPDHVHGTARPMAKLPVATGD